MIFFNWRDKKCVSQINLKYITFQEAITPHIHDFAIKTKPLMYQVRNTKCIKDYDNTQIPATRDCIACTAYKHQQGQSHCFN